MPNFLNRPAPADCTRREFLRRAALGAVAVCVAGRVRADAAAPRKLFSGIGITASIDRAAELKACGADYIVESVARFLIPDKPDADFEPLRAKAAAAPLPVLGYNSFLRDPKQRCTGPDADHPRVLAFSETAFRRLHEVGGEYIVFGSNTARQIPEGWPKARADEQFIALLRAMAPLAARCKIMVAVESQQQRECNYLNHLGEVAEVVAAVNHPNIRALADFYHMAIMGDTPADLTKAMPWVSLVELAEKEKRTPPGVAGDDFRPYFAALAKGGYSGRMDIEASGTDAQLKTAFETVRRQAADVM
jgi:sugar phosphate isomerase/epimerase